MTQDDTFARVFFKCFVTTSCASSSSVICLPHTASYPPTNNSPQLRASVRDERPFCVSVLVDVAENTRRNSRGLCNLAQGPPFRASFSSAGAPDLFVSFSSHTAVGSRQQQYHERSSQMVWCSPHMLAADFVNRARQTGREGKPPRHVCPSFLSSTRRTEASVAPAVSSLGVMLLERKLS